MQADITVFGECEGKKVFKYTLTNDRNTKLSVLNYAGIWHEFSVLDEGKRVNLILSSPKMEGYTDNPFYINRIIGRVAGRIKNGVYFNSQGDCVTTPQNEGENSLHGGGNGWDNTFFDGDIKDNSIILTSRITSEQDGFPGDLESVITYTLTNDDQVIIKMQGQQKYDEGVFNPTSHAYFNLGESENILDHTLKIKSHSHLGIDENKVPNGEIINNEGPYDLANQPSLRNALKLLSNTKEKGFDDVFVIDKSNNDVAATLKDTVSSRTIDITSNRNGLVVFTANSMTSNMPNNHGGGHKWVAVALEPHTLPNSENIPAFGDVTLKVNETRQETIIYRYYKSIN